MLKTTTKQAEFFVSAKNKDFWLQRFCGLVPLTRLLAGELASSVTRNNRQMYVKVAPK